MQGHGHEFLNVCLYAKIYLLKSTDKLEKYVPLSAPNQITIQMLYNGNTLL